MKLAGPLFLIGIICGAYLQDLGFNKRITAYQVVHETKVDKAK